MDDSKTKSITGPGSTCCAYKVQVSHLMHKFLAFVVMTHLCPVSGFSAAEAARSCCLLLGPCFLTDLLATGTGSNLRSLTLGIGSCAKMYAQRPPNHRHLALAAASMESVLAAASAEKASKLLELHSLSASRFAAHVHAMLDPNLWLCWSRLRCPLVQETCKRSRLSWGAVQMAGCLDSISGTLHRRMAILLSAATWIWPVAQWAN